MFFFFYFLFLKNLFLFLAVLGLRCCAGFSLLEGYSLDVLCGLLIVAVSLVAEHGFQGPRASVVGSVVVVPGLKSAGSIVVVHGPSCSPANGIFPDQWSNLCLLHWQADSLPLSHQGSPQLIPFSKIWVY